MSPAESRAELDEAYAVDWSLVPPERNTSLHTQVACPADGRTASASGDTLGVSAARRILLVAALIGLGAVSLIVTVRWMLANRSNPPPLDEAKAAELVLPSFKRLIEEKDAAGLGAFLDRTDPAARAALIRAYAGADDLHDAAACVLRALELAFGDAGKTASLPYELFLFKVLPGLENPGLNLSLPAQYVGQWLQNEGYDATRSSPGIKATLLHFFADLGIRSQADIRAWQNHGAGRCPAFAAWYERDFRAVEAHLGEDIGGAVERLLGS